MEIKDAIAILAANVMFACDKAQFSEACKASVEDALTMAISALKKQVGMKPQRREGTTYVFCPACGRPNIDDYCPRCGQKIDWED